MVAIVLNGAVKFSDIQGTDIALVIATISLLGILALALSALSMK